MTFIGTPRARIRARVIDAMTHEELRAFVTKLETAVDNGYREHDDDCIEEWVSEIFSEAEGEGGA